MISSIGSLSVTVGTPQDKQAQPSASLDAELAKYQGELADWITCPSGKTPAGMAIIKSISSKLEDVKVRIRTADRAASTDRAAAAQAALASRSATQSRRSGASAAASDAGNSPQMTRSSALSTLGAAVDVYV